MGAGHAHALYVHEHSPLHRLAPEVKIVMGFIFVGSVAVTPPRAMWAMSVYAVALMVVMQVSRVRARFVLTRLVAVAPFILFAFLIPFIASGDRIDVLGLSVSREGLWGMWNIVSKATLGATVSILLAATTEVPEILRGMGRLKVPGVLTTIAGFMIRYLELIASELGRMRVAMTSRGYDPRWLWQARPIASSAGALFIRSYERGERVYDAMLARGFTGTMPDLDRRRATAAQWLRSLPLAITGVVTAVMAMILS